MKNPVLLFSPHQESDSEAVFIKIIKGFLLSLMVSKHDRSCCEIILIAIDQSKNIHEHLLKEIDKKIKKLKKSLLLDKYRDLLLRNTSPFELLDEIDFHSYDVVIIICDIHSSNEFMKEIESISECDCQLLAVYSKCENTFKTISENQNPLFIFNITNNNNCYSTYIKTLYDEKPNFKERREFLEHKLPLISVLPASKADNVTAGYNYLSRNCNIIESKDHASLYDVDDKIYKLLRTVDRKTNFYFSYGYTKKSIKIIKRLEYLINTFFPNMFTCYDKIIDNYNRPLLEDYEKRLIDGDIVLFVINKKFLQSQYAMRELSKIYNKYNTFYPYLNKRIKFPSHFIILKDDKAKEILNSPTACDELVFSYWKNKISKSNEIITRCKNQEAKDQEKKNLDDYLLIEDNLPQIIFEIRENYDHKNIKEHLATNMSSILWNIYSHLKSNNEFDFYEGISSKKFESMVMNATELS